MPSLRQGVGLSPQSERGHGLPEVPKVYLQRTVKALRLSSIWLKQKDGKPENKGFPFFYIKGFRAFLAPYAVYFF